MHPNGKKRNISIIYFTWYEIFYMILNTYKYFIKWHNLHEFASETGICHRRFSKNVSCTIEVYLYPCGHSKTQSMRVVCLNVEYIWFKSHYRKFSNTCKHKPTWGPAVDQNRKKNHRIHEQSSIPLNYRLLPDTLSFILFLSVGMSPGLKEVFWPSISTIWHSDYREENRTCVWPLYSLELTCPKRCTSKAVVNIWFALSTLQRRQGFYPRPVCLLIGTQVLGPELAYSLGRA